MQSKIFTDIGSRQCKQVIKSLLTTEKTDILSDDNNIKNGMVICSYVQTLSAAEVC